MAFDLSDEELEATRRMKGLIKDEPNIKENIENLKEYLAHDMFYQNPERIQSDFDKFCYNHCKDIEIVLKALEEKE